MPAPQPINLPLQYPLAPVSDASDRPHPKPQPACHVYLAEARDIRADKENLGQIDSIPVVAGDTGAWLTAGVKSIGRGQDIAFVDSATAEPGALTLRIDLLKAYFSTINTAEGSTVVLRAQFSRNGSAPEETIYRGAGGRFLWGTGKSGMTAELSDTLTKALAPLRRDILARCAQATGASAP